MGNPKKFYSSLYSFWLDREKELLISLTRLHGNGLLPSCILFFVEFALRSEVRLFVCLVSAVQFVVESGIFRCFFKDIGASSRLHF